LRKITTLGIEVDFRWIPAHRGVPGNEAADQTAKQAAEVGTRPARAAPQERQNQNRIRDQHQDRHRGIRTLLTTAKRIINGALQDDWDTIWKQGKHGRVLHSLASDLTRKLVRRRSARKRADD
jgi:ribonuclease HI